MKRKMRGGKDERNQMDPLFPRLHINDAETGGPRAPPRNKMALCEQVVIPSQGLSSGSMSMGTLSHGNSTNLASSVSPSQVHCHEKNGFSLFCSLPDSSHHMTERLNSKSSGGMSLNTKYSEFEILKPGIYQSFSARRPLRMTSECILFPPCFYNSTNSSAMKHGNKDDIRIPYFGRTEQAVNCGSVGLKMGKEKVISSSLSISVKHQTALERQEKKMERNDVKSREHPKNQTEDNCKISEMGDDNTETHHTHPLTEENVLTNTAPSVLALYGTCKSGEGALAPTNHKRRTVVKDLRTLHDTCMQKHQKYKSFPIDTVSVDNVSKDPETLSRKSSFPRMEFPSCSSPPTGENNRNLNRLESVNQHSKGNDFTYSHVGDVERSTGISDSYVMNCGSGLRMSPDDVVRVIGPKLFWRVRRTIAHQQKIFAVQIFELHRLIKVQRLIAGPPEILFEDSVILSRPSIHYSPEKKLQLENYPEQPAVFLKPKVDFQRPKPCLDYLAEEEAHRKLPPPTYANENRHVTPRSTLKPNSGAQTTISFAPDATFGPWGSPTTPGNQWLIPMKSASEGLIYKPYTGPFPPNAGFIAPVYGGCGALSLTRLDGDYLNTVYDVPTTVQRGIGIYTSPASLGRPSCFQTYSLPVINTSSSSSVVEQTSAFATACSSGMDNHRVSTYNISYIVPYRSSYDITSRGIMTDSTGNSQVSKGSDIFQDSTASNPDEKVQGDALPLFPTTPTVQMSKHPDQNDNTEQQIQVIKVVPHNPKSASESAARIFWSIQEERKQHK